MSNQSRKIARRGGYLPTEITDWIEQRRTETAGEHGVNAYKCGRCGLNTVTIDVDTGVTPAYIACRRTPGCEGVAVSSNYPTGDPPPHIMEHLAWEWYRPSQKEFRELDAESQAHVSMGGLLLREFKGGNHP